MWSLLIKYASQVTAAKAGGAESKEAMRATATATLNDQEKYIMTRGRMPELQGRVDDAAWDVKTYSEAYPDEVAQMLSSPYGAPIVQGLDEALTPVP